MSVQTTDAPPEMTRPEMTPPEATDSLLLGPVAAGADARFDFPAGLFAFEQCRGFVLVPAGRDGLWWLQSAERAELTFLLADPFRFFAGYEVQVPPAELLALGHPREGTVAVLVVVTLPAPHAAGGAATANLRAPVLLDARRRVGRQVVLPDERHAVAAPLVLG